MNLFDRLPKELFSILASPNKVVYSDALLVLYDAFQENLKISKDTLFTMLRSRLENVLVYSSFEDEGIEEEELQDLSGKARFLIRKLKERGWIDIEHDNNFIEYVIIPEYSIRIIELLKSIVDGEKASGFSYVYDTYSSLKLSNEDENSGAYEKMMALSSARDKTAAMIKTLKRVYHNVNRYVQQLIDNDNINEILSAHYDDFYQKVIEAHIQPLKIKDSIPKYKNPILRILDSWLENDALIDAMAEASAKERQMGTAKERRYQILSDIFFIRESYGNIEQDYMSEIDDKVRKYTRATTKKIEYLTNTDRTVQGNLVYLLNTLANTKDDELISLVSSSVQLFHQSYICEKSLYHSRRAQRRQKLNPILVDEQDYGLDEKVRAEYHRMMNSPYHESNVREYMERLFGDSPVVFSDDMTLADDYTYILSLLAVLHGNDKEIFYKPEFLEGSVQKNGYTVPKIRFVRKKGK